MGYRKIPRIYTLEFQGELEGMIVRTKSVKFGRMRKIMTMMDDDGRNDADVMETLANELSDVIVSWNLEDENGKEIPVSRESIDDLEYEEVIAIVNEWLGALTGPDPDLGKDSSSGETFPGQPLTMEAL